MISTGQRKRQSWRLSNTKFAECVKYTVEFLPETEIDKRDKKILEYIFINGMTATAISEMKDPMIISTSNRSKGKPLSASSILEIVYKHIPELRHRESQSKRKSTPKRIELMNKRRNIKSPHERRCAFCGKENELEEHHMIPLCLGGDNQDENLVYLCRNCHMAVSKYQRKLLK